MPAISRKGDANGVGGKIVKGAPTVFANGQPVGLHVSEITAHAPFGKPHPPHRAAKTTQGSATVFADGEPVLFVGAGTTCGHNIAEGSGDVFVP